MEMIVSSNPGLRRQLFAGISASLGALCSASLYGWLTPILPHLLGPDSEIPMTPQEVSWMIAAPTLFNMMSPIPAGLLADRIGRKRMLLLSAPFYTLGWIIILYYRSYGSLIVARSIQEFITGIVFTVIPVYLGEIASKELRGTITSTFFVTYWAGLLFNYCTGPFLSFTNFTCLNLTTSCMFFLMCWFLPESPHFLLVNGRKEAAFASLCWLRASTEEVENEFKAMVRSAENEPLERISWKDMIATPTDRKALWLILFVGGLRVFSGTQPIIAYATENFTGISNLTIEPKYITMLFGLVLLLGACSSSFTLDFFGRKPLIVWSSFAASLTLFVVGTVYYLESKTDVDMSQWSWVAPVFTMIYAAVVVAGLFPVNIAYQSELFTSKTRSNASGICNLFTVFLIMVELKLYQDFIDNFGVYFNFYLFGGLCLVGAIFSIFYMPETKNKTFEEIRNSLTD